MSDEKSYWDNHQVRRTFEVIAREQNAKAKTHLDYIKYALSLGHTENAIAVLYNACEMLHDAIEALQMQIDQIQNQINR